MKINRSHWAIRNQTFFSLLCPLSVIASIFYVVYLSINEPGAELVYAVMFLTIVAAAAIYAFDRVFAKFFKNTIISIVEIGFSVLILLLVYK